MQRPGRAALPPSTSTYSDQQIFDQLLRGGMVQERWTYDLLDADLSMLGDLTPDTSPQNSQLAVDTTSDVQATLSLSVLGNQIDALRNLIRPHYRFMMPDGGWVDFTLGMFNLLPSGDSISRGYSLNTYTCADSAQLLSDAAIGYAAGVGAGTNYIQAITSVVESYGGKTPIHVTIPDTGLKLPAALSWNAGTSRIAIVNQMLSAMNYHPAWFDQTGRLRSSPIPDYRYVSETASFDTTTDAIALGSVSSAPDFSQVFNQFLLTVSNPATSVSNGSAATSGSSTGTGQGFSAYYENDDPASPISTANWHPKLKQWSDSSIADRATAYAACVTAAQVSSRIYAPLTFSTPCWPLSQSNDIYRMRILAADEGDTNYLYVETGWTMTLQTGGTTSHTFERVG